MRNRDLSFIARLTYKVAVSSVVVRISSKSALPLNLLSALLLTPGTQKSSARVSSVKPAGQEAKQNKRKQIA